MKPEMITREEITEGTFRQDSVIVKKYTNEYIFRIRKVEEFTMHARGKTPEQALERLQKALDRVKDENNEVVSIEAVSEGEFTREDWVAEYYYSHQPEYAELKEKIQ
jgi:predicted RNase H-like HicB family nuclease